MEPAAVVVAAVIEMTGVEPPEDAMGAVPVTLDTPLGGKVTHLRPVVVVESTDKNCPLLPAVNSDGVLELLAPTKEPFAVKMEGAITADGLRAIVPLDVMVPPVKPVPAVILVTDPTPVPGKV
jgi:hypothetical protein